MQALISKTPYVSGSPPCRQHNRAQQKQHSRVVSVSATSKWQEDPAFKRLMVLPGGAWFMSSDPDAEAPVYGDSFIMHGAHAHNRTSSTAGLVRVRQRPITAVQRQRQHSRDIIPLRLEDVEVSIVVLPTDRTAGSTTTLVLSSRSQGSSSIVPFRRLLADPDTSDQDLELTVTTSYTSTPDSSSSSSTSLAIVPRDNTMLGVVMSSAMRRRDDNVQLPVDDETVYETPFNDKNPRRTMKIKFKCKRCGATTIKPINPHAWATGTVFAKCGCCQVTHKLIDNLKLFHELAGPVFSPGTQAPKPRRERLGLRLDSDSNTLPQLPPRLRLRLPLDNFPDDIAGLN